MFHAGDHALFFEDWGNIKDDSEKKLFTDGSFTKGHLFFAEFTLSMCMMMRVHSALVLLAHKTIKFS